MSLPGNKGRRSIRVCVIDDDPAMDILVEAFEYRGHEASRIPTAALAFSDEGGVFSSDVVVLDILIPLGDAKESSNCATMEAGMSVFRWIRNRCPDLPVVALTATQDYNIIAALTDDRATRFISKWESHPVRNIIAEVYAVTGVDEPKVDPLKSFIVHGRNEVAKLELKNYLQNTLKLPEPIILHEQPSLGRTIIEKFETHAAQAALVFVLLTPDDLGGAAADPDDVKRRSRQNVIFELGYFLGVLGRESGRVLLLYRGDVELPSDLAGVVYIDINSGIATAGEQIRKEIAHVLGN